MIKRCFVLSLLHLLSLPSVLSAAEYPAQLQWADVHIVSVPVEAMVSDVAVHAGQRIKAGEVLLQLRDEPLRHALRAAQAKVAALQPQLEDAQREKNDAEALYEQTVLSDVELQAAQIRYRRIEAQMQQAHAELALARWRASWATLHSPVDGIVIERNVHPGQMIAGDHRSKPLLQLASMVVMLAQAQIPAKLAAALAPGEVLSVVFAGKRHRAVVSEIILLPDRQGQVQLRARFTPAGPALAGQSATLILP